MASQQHLSFRTLVLSGGGPRCASFLGCLQHLEEEGLLKEVVRYVGCSAGSMICLLLSMGVASADIRRHLVDDFRQYGCHELDVDQIFDFPTAWGLDDGSKLVAFFRRCIARFLPGAPSDGAVSFAGLQALSPGNRRLVVCVSNLTTGQHQYMDAARTPDMDVALALRMSVSIPFIYSPVSHEGALFVDGGLFNNFPLDFAEEEEGPGSDVDTLGISLPFTVETDPAAAVCNSLGDYTRLVLGRLVNRSNLIARQQPQPPNVFVIEVPAPSQNHHPADCPDVDEEDFSLDALSFPLSDGFLETCFEHGYEICRARLAEQRRAQEDAESAAAAEVLIAQDLSAETVRSAANCPTMEPSDARTMTTDG